MSISPRISVAMIALLSALAGFGVGWVSRRELAKPAMSTDRLVTARPSKSSSSPIDRKAFVDPRSFEADLFGTVARYTGAVVNESSIGERGKAIDARVPAGLKDLLARQAEVEPLIESHPERLAELIDLYRSLSYFYIYDCQYGEADRWLRRALALCERPGVSSDDRLAIRALLGIASLRRGELENCVACIGPSSCIFPIERAAVHQYQQWSRGAIEHFSAYLKERPGDLRVRWLLNLAYMTLGEYPAKVPPGELIPLDAFRSKVSAPRFTNVASQVGLATRGPGLAGGSIFDDFNGDNRPDIFATSIDTDRGASLFLNQGDGTFADASAEAGLDEQVYALNVRRADFDNDGDLDVLLLRGGWETPARLSLLRNDGRGHFDDVTTAAGLGEPIASEAAEWGDYDNDGLVDLFVCGEFQPGSLETRNLCRLYHNRGNGTFEDVAPRAGVQNDRYAKGAAWGDIDNDGDLDLFVSNMSVSAPMQSRLYRNRGDGTFEDVAGPWGIKGASHDFTCTFWDFDDDGWLDLLVSDYHDSLAEVVGVGLGLDVKTSRRPSLYRNLQGRGFEDVSLSVGLARPIPAMSLNIGDLDNDGWLDLHFGTGWMALEGLTPDLTFLNRQGRHFDDVTEVSATGHLQKGHGVSFADWDADGDLDFFVVYGGGYPGDRGHSALFQNAGAPGTHWLKLKLVGTRSNRAALGARVEIELSGTKGPARTIHRVIGNNGSFGGNSLVEHVGLAQHDRVERVRVFWPASGTTQVFENVPCDRFVEITEGRETLEMPKQSPVHVPEH
jgi:hypothetical protein